MEELADRVPRLERKRPRPRAERAADHEERRGDDHQHFVLHHVRREQVAAQRVERADERARGGKPCRRERESAARLHAAAGPGAPPQPSDSYRVRHRAEQQARHDPWLERPPQRRRGGVDVDGMRVCDVRRSGKRADADVSQLRRPAQRSPQ